AAGSESRTAGGNGAAMRSAAERARQLGVHLVAPLPPTASHVGGFLLAARTDGRLYTREDERLLETLAAQTVVALDNARAWEEVRRLEQRLARRTSISGTRCSRRTTSPASSARALGCARCSPKPSAWRRPTPRS